MRERLRCKSAVVASILSAPSVARGFGVRVGSELEETCRRGDMRTP